MNSVGIFLADDRLRPIWRFFLSVALVYAALALSAAILGTVFLICKVRPSPWVAAFWHILVGLIGVIGVSKLMTAAFEQRPLGSIGLALHPRWGRELGRGLVVGGAMLSVGILPAVTCGFTRFSFAPHPMLPAGSFSMVLFAAAAANEEIIFRGYPFQRLAEAITPAGATAATSALFGLVHLANPHWTWISAINTALVGVPFCIAYLRTRSLWMPIGIHLGWNFLMGFFLGLPVSGLTIPISVLTARVQGPIWVTGGQYGPEGSLLALGAILVGTAYLSLTKSIYITEEMKVLVFAPATSHWPDPPLTIFSASPQKGAKRD
jgi:membrane protease YdiL (CAAX protease family)